MEAESFEKFKEESNIDIIKGIMKANNGYITAKQVTELGIHRMYLKIMLDRNIIEKVGKGIYIDKKSFEDSFFTFQLIYPKTIYSRFTALYFYNLTEVNPISYDLTVDYNYHVNKINKNHSVIRCKKDIISLGLIKTKTPFGNEVNAYDRERCICDIIRFRKKLDLEQVKKSVKMYINDSNKNLNKLSEYSKKLHIYKDVIEFVGMYYE